MYGGAYMVTMGVADHTVLGIENEDVVCLHAGFPKGCVIDAQWTVNPKP